MKLLLLTDIHERKKYVKNLVEKYKGSEEFDKVLVAGDITYFKPMSKAVEILRIIREGIGREVFFVPGNCDDPRLLDWSSDDEGIVNIHSRVRKLGDYIVYGIGGSNRTPFSTYIEWSEEELDRLLKPAYSINRDRLIMVTHSPPRGILDNVGYENVGSISLRNFLEDHGAKLWVTGHIHEERGKIEYRGTVVVNPGPLMWGYYGIAVVNEKGVHVELARL